MQKWSVVKERGGMLPLMLMLGFYRLGGRWLCRLVLYFVILWYWLFSNTARQASLLYLKKLHYFAGSQSPFFLRTADGADLYASDAVWRMHLG